MTNEEAALILHPDTTMFALDEAMTRDDKTRFDLVEEACRMGAEALRNGTKVIIRRLDHPFPEAEDGYAPVPWANNFEGDGRPDSGLLVDDEFGCPFDDGVGTIDDGVDMSSSPYEGSTIVVDDWGGA